MFSLDDEHADASKQTIPRTEEGTVALAHSEKDEKKSGTTLPHGRGKGRTWKKLGRCYG